MLISAIVIFCSVVAMLWIIVESEFDRLDKIQRMNAKKKSNKELMNE